MFELFGSDVRFSSMLLLIHKGGKGYVDPCDNGRGDDPAQVCAHGDLQYEGPFVDQGYFMLCNLSGGGNTGYSCDSDCGIEIFAIDQVYQITAEDAANA